MDGVHIYEVPLPGSFFESGGRRQITVALAYDPETRVRRLDYLASRLEFHLVRGLTVEETRQAFLTVSGEEAQEVEENAVDEDEDSSAGSSPSLQRHLVKLDPPARLRSRGTNQLGRVELGQRLRPDRYGESLLLVVKNTNYWATPGTMQPYAVAVALSRDSDHSEIYADLQARVEVPVEVEVRTTGS